MRARRPLRARKPIAPINRERKVTLRERQYGTEDFQAWCHRQACQVPGCENRNVEMAHAKSKGAGGMWTDVAILCRDHHREQHVLGILTWERKFGTDLRVLAAAVQCAWSESR